MDGAGAAQGADDRVHRALASPARRRLLAMLRSATTPLGVTALTEDLGLHANTVRAHLEILEEAGLVASEPEPRDRPGRPRRLFRATSDTAEVGEGRGYRFLARILASHLAATAPDPAAAAEEAGSAWGRYLVDRPPPFQPVPASAGVDRLVELLDEVGFAPTLDADHEAGPTVALHRCPFLEVATEHREVVCSIHLGLMRGALDELGVDVQVRDLLPFVAPGLCVSHLEVPPEA